MTSKLDSELGRQAIHYVAEVAHALPGVLGCGGRVLYLLCVVFQLPVQLVKLGFRVIEFFFPAQRFHCV